MFIDWLPEVLRSWRLQSRRTKRTAPRRRVTPPVSANVEILEPLALLTQGVISFDRAVYTIPEPNLPAPNDLGERVTITLTDLDLVLQASQFVQVLASNGDVEPVTLTAQGTPGTFVGSIDTKNLELTGTLPPTQSGFLEVPRGSQISVSYFDAVGGNGSPNTTDDEATFYVLGDVQPTDFNISSFNDASGSGGFTTSLPAATNQWHLSTGRSLSPGHSEPNSFYFGQGEDPTTVGNYLDNMNGTLTSPLIDLTKVADGVRLKFNQLLDLDFGDTATISVISGGVTTPIASSNGVNPQLFNTSPGTFAPVTFDLSAFAGRKIQVAFQVVSNGDSVTGEGWYVDDVELEGPVGAIQGKKWNDANGNGLLDVGESPLSGWTMYIDQDNNHVLNNILTTAIVGGLTGIPDSGQATSSVTISNLVSKITDVNITLSINHPEDSDLSVVLISAAGTRVPLFTGVGGSGANFVSTKLDDQASVPISQGSAPFIGSFIPEGSLALLNDENPNGVWTLEIRDNFLNVASGTLLNWSLDIFTPEVSAVTQVDDPLTTDDETGRYSLQVYQAGTFNVREVPQAGWIQTSPIGASQQDPNPGVDVTILFGGIVQGIDFYNTFTFPVVDLPDVNVTPPAVLTYTENDPPTIIDDVATVSDPDSLNFNGGNLTVTLTVGATVDDRLEIQDQGVGFQQVSLLGGDVYYQNVLIGTASGGDGFNPLVVSFNINATPEAAQFLIRAIQFSIAGDNPSDDTRTVQFVVTDDTNGESVPVTKQIVVVTKNSPPVITLTGGSVDYHQNDPPQSVDLFASVSDPDSPNFAGGSLQVTLKGNETGPVTTTRKSFSNATNSLPLTLDNNASGTNTSKFIVGGVSGLLSDVNVTLNIVHPNVRELTATLIGPNGARVELFTNVTSGGVNFINTTLDDQAATTINTGTAPYTGRFRPNDPLSNLQGISPNGTWSLEVIDLAGGRSGVLNSWSIDVTTQNAAESTLFPPEPQIVNNGTLDSPLDVSGLTGTLTDVNVTIDILHNADIELSVGLIAPDGTVVGLVAFPPNSGRNFTDTTFDDQAQNNIDNFNAPYTDTFMPLEPLSVLNGINPNGTWQLRVVDINRPGVNPPIIATLRSWTLDLGMSSSAAPVSGLSVPLNNGTINSLVSVAGMNGKLSDVNVTVDITHSNSKDLTATLISPTGTRVKLFDSIGNTSGIGNTGFNNTTLDDEAILPNGAPKQIVTGTAPYAGFFVPEKSLSLFDGEDANGIWTLEVTDINSGLLLNGSGTLDSWFLDLTTTNTSTNETLSILDQGSGEGAVGLIGPDGNNLTYVTYGGDVIGTVTGGVGTDPLVIKFVKSNGTPNTNATAIAVQTVMQNITIEITGNNPIAGQRQVEFILDDADGPFFAPDGVTPIVGGGLSTPAIRIVNVIPSNDDPLLTLPSGQATYVAKAQPTVLDSFATVADDSTDFDSGLLTVTLGTTGQPNDILAIRSSGQGAGQISVSSGVVRFGTSVIGTVTGGSGGTPLAVNLSGTAATAAAVQALVRAITFQAVDAVPSTAVRIATFQLIDGDTGVSSAVDKVIAVSLQNSPPVLTLSTVVISPNATPLSQVSYNANGMPVVLDALATVTDSNTMTFNGGKLTVALTAGASGRDRLEVASPQGLVTVSGNNVLFAGTTVGKLTTGAGTSPLTIDFNSFASIESVQAVVRSINFQILGPNATAGNRTVTFTITDGSGGTSQTRSRTILVQITNLPPVNTVPSLDYAALEDTPLVLKGLGVSDPDASLLPIRVTLAVQNGKLTLDTSVTGGVTDADVTGNGTNQVVVTADQDSINKTLNSLYGVEYQGLLDFNGQDQLTFTTSDEGNSGPGGVLTDPDAVFINVQAVFDTVRVTASAGVTSNNRGKEALIDSGITATLADDQNSLDGAVLTVGVTSVILPNGNVGKSKHDSFRLLFEGREEGQINVSSARKGVSTLKIGTLSIGTVKGGTNGKPLVITFNAAATEADLQHVLKSITFRTGQKSIVYGLRTIRYSFSNSAQLASTPADKQLEVIRP